jgi:succinyl-diaminopimelate desuccinylase
VSGRYHAGIEVDVVHQEQAPAPTPADAEVVRRLVGALKEQRGIEPVICGAGGQTVAACLRKQGYDTAVWATLMPNPHAPNECSSIAATIADAKIVLRMLFDA